MSSPCDITFAGSNENDVQERTIVVDCKKSKDILASLIPLAEEEGLLHIVGADGFVSHVEFLNRHGAPLPVDKDLEILFLEGNIVYPKKNGKNLANWANVILSGKDGLLGGPVKSLVAKSRVEVTLSTVGKTHNITTEDMAKDMLNHMDDLNEVMNQVYEETLKKLEQS